ncbi:hypothetical protein G7B40_027505 [Aetokthonos hydrillicola Thurmond2011]|jgi:hypothetical protein|uniref:Plastid lipid-associated protein/fibrillin conserved domain-containing protein n=1 Tax=Aetokthonos hydrillicola Thurmond2011 TaxID=2712845 RepID=A0AAP5MCF7_9CYAN|nr:hypothetical protein [Aetokthonos hydrillicola]MBO3459228.1 hypothetical protein [Aetokthonos hydrillicola CCALA 1050]MBW4584188.1 hypothetical protein [Aetokthonos hydrillicola CCALA 1050]MDR9898278.1 hypothetical protein [Aetokthonos hydrillicola Thurmond2011]
MTANLTSQDKPDFIDTLTQTAAAYREQNKERPSAAVVVDALLQAEKAAKEERLSYPFESLLGQWRLCFITGTKKVRKRGGIVLGKGFYLPKFAIAKISFNASLDSALGKGEICNQLQLGSLLLKLVGPAKYPGKKNILTFDFTQMQVSLFGRVVYNQEIRGGKVKSENFYNQPIAKLPFFTFFLVTGDLIAARGRGGGLAIWIREN